MKICKFACHRGVDKMLKAALGDRLYIYQHSDDPYRWINMSDLKVIQSDVPEDIEWDAIIIDDMSTWQFFQDHEISTRNRIWYVHGTYERWQQFQDFANQYLRGYHLIFTDFARRASVLSWYENQIESTLILPIHLTNDYYVQLNYNRNEKCCIVGNRLLHNCCLYPNYERIGLTIEQLYKSLGSDRLQIYGWNDRRIDQITDWAVLPSECLRGPVDSIKSLRNYSVSYHPSFVPTLSFVQLEVMAAGVAVVTTPKWDFGPITTNPPPYIISESPTDTIEAITKLVDDPEWAYNVGAEGQKYLRTHFPFDFYKETLSSHLENVLR